MAINNFDVFNSACWAENSINKILGLLNAQKVAEAAETCQRDLAAIRKLKERYEKGITASKRIS